MVKNPKKYMREYQRKRRARLKAERDFPRVPKVEEPKVDRFKIQELVEKGVLTPISEPDTSVCFHCRSKHFHRVGINLWKCDNCGLTFDLDKFKPSEDEEFPVI
jgi:hypothetical protein